MTEFNIIGEYVELTKLLKATQLVESGAMAKEIISEGLVTRNEKVEYRKRAKIKKGEIIAFEGEKIKVV